MRIYKRFKRPRAFTFDLDDTLYDNMPHMYRAEKKLVSFLCKLCPQTADTDATFWRNYKHDWIKRKPELLSDMGQLRLLTLTSGLMACGLSQQEAEKQANIAFDYFYFQRSDFTVSDEVTSVLGALCEVVPLIAITNGNVNLKQIGIEKYFTAVFKSSVTQPMKPHAMMFRKAAASLSIEATAIMHVGDHLEKDVFGAINADFQAAWIAVNREMDLRNEQVSVLPHIQLDGIHELVSLI